VFKSSTQETQAPSDPSASTWLNSQPLSERVTSFTFAEAQEGVPFLASSDHALRAAKERTADGSWSTVGYFELKYPTAVVHEGSQLGLMRTYTLCTSSWIGSNQDTEYPTTERSSSSTTSSSSNCTTSFESSTSSSSTTYDDSTTSSSSRYDSSEYGRRIEQRVERNTDTYMVGFPALLWLIGQGSSSPLYKGGTTLSD
jgi:hypothetical protein